MSNPTNPKPATVRRSLLRAKTVAAGLSALDNTCASGAQCPAVQASAVAQGSLVILQKAVTTAHGSLTAKNAASQALQTSQKQLRLDYKAVRVALGTYETAVQSIAGGSAAVINQAGLAVRDQSVPAAALTAVSVVHTKPGKRATEAILSWPAAPGAKGYALEVNFTPQVAGSPWVSLTSGTGRRRIVKAPTPGAQFLVRVASLGSDGTQADWSAAVMATAL
jgi:hypothetical protein